MRELEEKLQYRFRDPSLLQTALTHSSYTNEHPHEQAACYERLEFLGDAVLGLTAAELLYAWSPELPEGRMTRIRAELVCEESLCSTARSLDIGRWMRLGKGEELSHGRERPSILADMVEALIAAIYLDGGSEAATDFIRRFVLHNAADRIRSRSIDNKTMLQELVQQQPGSTIRYELVSEDGPDHDKRFFYRVYVNDAAAGEGSGRSKKEAEQAAAGAALGALTGENGCPDHGGQKET